MAQVRLRVKAGLDSPEDLEVSVQEKTFDHLLTTVAPTIRVSAYLEKDVPRVESDYAELFVSAKCAFVSAVEKVIPGSRSRTGITLPGPMSAGEQLTVLVVRSPAAGS